ncbi:MAG: cytochrome bc complex cytochrome b subunit [Solirubrobacterales bacterium]|nr:cytochrome bc complex cytochrome b subunit [Solirubrobacterales bacterium]
MLLVLTGVYLAQFYDPTPERAHASVAYITDTVFAGELIRSLHYWLTSAFVVTLVLHMVRAFATASFKAPREMTWITGVLLFLLAAGLLFSGTVLRADQEAVEALAHNNEIANLFGVLGFWFSADFTDNVSIITRLYIAHVSILPVLVGAVLAVHMLLIKRHRMSPLPRGSAEEVAARERAEHAEPFTSHLKHIGKWALVLLGATLLLAGLAPTGLGPAGIEGIEITKPPWYFLWLYPLENWVGLDALWVFPGILALGLLAIPFLERSPERDPRRRRAWIALGAAVLIAWLALTVYGALTVPVPHIEMGG